MLQDRDCCPCDIRFIALAAKIASDACLSAVTALSLLVGSWLYLCFLSFVGVSGLLFFLILLEAVKTLVHWLGRGTAFAAVSVLLIWRCIVYWKMVYHLDKFRFCCMMLLNGLLIYAAGELWMMQPDKAKAQRNLDMIVQQAIDGPKNVVRAVAVSLSIGCVVLNGVLGAFLVRF